MGATSAIKATAGDGEAGIDLRKHEFVVDEGAFVLFRNDEAVAEERFVLVGRQKKGLFGSKLAQYRLASTVTGRGGRTFSMQTTFRFDAKARALGVEADCAGCLNGGAGEGKSHFSLKSKRPNSVLRVRRRVNPIQMRVPYRKEALIRLEPSLIAFVMLPYRYRAGGPDAQEFDWTTYNTEGGGLTMMRSFLVGGILARTERALDDGGYLDLVHYMFEEWPVKGGARAEAPVRRWHLWSDRQTRLQRVVSVDTADPSVARLKLQRVGASPALDELEPGP